MFSLSHVLQTAETLLSYRNEDFLCDTILVAKDCRLKAHSVVLAAVSPIFKAAFCTGAFPSGTFQVDLPDVDSEVLQTALDFIYTGELILPSPTYASANQLSVLFSTLKDLGLDIEKLNGSELKFRSDAKNTRLDGGESMKVFPGKSQQQRPKSVLDDSDTSFSTDPDLSVSTLTFGRPEVTASGSVKKDDDDWNWNDVTSDNVRLDKHPGSTAVGSDEDVLVNLTTADDDDKIDDDDEDDIAKMQKEDEGCMLIEMTTGTEGEEDGGGKFVVVSPQSGALESSSLGKLEGLGSGDAAMAHKCKSCNRQFARRQSLVRHEKTYHSGSASVAVGEHVCQLCSEAFTRRADLDSHMAMKHVNQPSTRSVVRCSTCHKQCTSLTEFNAHLEESPDCASGADVGSRIIFAADSDEINYRPFLCDICGKNFSTALALRMHHKLHTGERPFACTTCGKSFVQKIQLTQHELRHLGIRPFACTICNRTFSQKGQLTQHHRLHSGDRPFVCECGADFLSKAMLSQHRRTHSGDRPHVCATCGRAFAYKESLVVHIRTHTGEKPFECAICGSRYTQSHHLKGHLRTHTGEKPFACHLCEKTYKNRVDLRFHCTRVHNVDITKRHAKPSPMQTPPSAVLTPVMTLYP